MLDIKTQKTMLSIFFLNCILYLDCAVYQLNFFLLEAYMPVSLI
jgi:hypothetical protein